MPPYTAMKCSILIVIHELRGSDFVCLKLWTTSTSSISVSLFLILPQPGTVQPTFPIHFSSHIPTCNASSPHYPSTSSCRFTQLVSQPL